MTKEEIKRRGGQGEIRRDKWKDIKEEQENKRRTQGREGEYIKS